MFNFKTLEFNLVFEDFLKVIRLEWQGMMIDDLVRLGLREKNEFYIVVETCYNKAESAHLSSVIILLVERWQ